MKWNKDFAKLWAKGYFKFELGRVLVLGFSMVVTKPNPWFWTAHILLTMIFLLVTYIMAVSEYRYRQDMERIRDYGRGR